MNYCRYCISPIEENANFCSACGKSQGGDIPLHHLRPGTVLNGRYLVGAVLGEGDFGITYIGRDEIFDSRVAVKEYFPYKYVQRNNFFSPAVQIVDKVENRNQFEKGRQFFISEAQTMAGFTGEAGLVNIFDFFEENNTAYTVMEYIEGSTLKSIIKRETKLPPDAAISLLMPVMESLKTIHARGLIHSDISPDNIIVAKDCVKLLCPDVECEMTDYYNDDTDVLLMPNYAPEEQNRGEGEQGPWTDVYALCATLYKCITGRTPDDSIQRFYRDTTIKPRKLGVKNDRKLEAAIMKGMAVHRQDRFQSVDELLEALKTAQKPAKKHGFGS